MKPPADPRFCFFCGADDLSYGYGLAAGPLGAYTFCNKCDQLLAYEPDMKGLNGEDAARLREYNKRLQNYLRNSQLSWRRREEIIHLRKLLALFADIPSNLSEVELAKIREQINQVKQMWNTKGDCI